MVDLWGGRLDVEWPYPGGRKQRVSASSRATWVPPSVGNEAGRALNSVSGLPAPTCVFFFDAVR
jgi:hypothetical protein